jgi:hypothetical protein
LGICLCNEPASLVLVVIGIAALCSKPGRSALDPSAAL